MNKKTRGSLAFTAFATFITFLMFDFDTFFSSLPYLNDRFFYYFLAFIAFLITLIFLVRTPQKETSHSSPQPPPIENITPEGLTLDISTKYQHSITVANFQVAQKLMSLLNQQGIKSTLVKGEDLKLQFTAPQKLQNIQELKKKGLIKDAKITEVF